MTHKAMKNTDNKKSPMRINSVIFAILWALSYLFGAGAAYFLTFTLFEPPLQEVPWWYTFGMIFTLLTTMGIVSSSMQRFAMWLRFGRRLTWWRRTSVIGWWMGGLLTVGLSRLYFASEIPTLNWLGHPVTLILALSTPWIVMQWLVLRRHVDRAWLYILTSLSGSTVFGSLLISMNDGLNFFGMSLALGGSAVIIAYTLVWLFSMSGNVVAQRQNIADTSRFAAGANRLLTENADEAIHDTMPSDQIETKSQQVSSYD
jgi:hypothetical protein